MDFSNDPRYKNDYDKAEFITHVVTCIIIAIGLPLTLVAICFLFSLVRKDHVAPIYVINLLISGLIQLCCMIVREALPHLDLLFYLVVFPIHLYGVVVSVGFMVCIALERYLVIVYPLWYCFGRTVKISVAVCVSVWVVPVVLFLPLLFFFPYLLFEPLVPLTLVTFIAVILLLPFPLFIFFLGGTLKALSASISVSSEEKRRIVGSLVLVLLIYTLLILPFIINVCIMFFYSLYIPTDLTLMLLKLSPLADLVLYIFMRKGAIDKLLASLCCCRMDNNDEMDSNDVSSPSV